MPTSLTTTPAVSSWRSASISTAEPPCTAIDAALRRLVDRRLAETHLAQHLFGGRQFRRVRHGQFEALAADLRLQLVGSAARDHLAVVDHHDRLREPIGLFQILRREQQRRAAVDELFDDVPHAEAAARVEARRRLVEKQHPRFGDQAASEVEAAAHAAGVGLHDAIRCVDKVEPLEQLVGSRERSRPCRGDTAARPCRGFRDRSGFRRRRRTAPKRR